MSDLPPLDQPQAYVVVGPNDQRGPYALELLIGEVAAGRLHEATPVWWPGLAEWTTMNAHAGVAAEVARRRGAVAPSPQYAPQPQAGSVGQYAPQPQADPVGQYAPQPQADPVGQYAPQPQMDPVGQYAPQPQMDLGTQVVPQPEPAVIEPTQDTSASTEVVDVDEVTVHGAGVTESPDAEVGASVTDEHRSAFEGLVERSRSRSEAVARIQAVDGSFVDAVVSGAESQGFTSTDRSGGGGNHELRFDGATGETLTVTVGRIEGEDPAEVRAASIPFTVRFQSAAYGGALESGSGVHGEVVIVSDEWSGQATSTVTLLLALEDYLDADLAVDAVAVLRDVGATVSVVSGRMR